MEDFRTGSREMTQASYIAYHGKVAFQHPVTSDDTGKLHRVTW